MNRKGLTFAQVEEKQKIFGSNELPAQSHSNALHILKHMFSEPMIMLLIFCVVIYFLMGERSEAILLAASIAFILGVEFYQERKSQKALEALKDLSAPKALVVREGQKIKIEARELVPGDLIILSEGDRVPADAVILELTHLSVDESLLTGESLAVNKGNGENIFSGTLIVAGSAQAEVRHIGSKTEMGKIGKFLEHISDTETLLQRDTKKLVKISGTLGIIFSVLVVGAHFRAHTNLVESILAGLATAMSLLPEEFPVIVAIFLSLGAWRLSQKNVLVRHLGTTENIGSLNILCVDKTGTLTENKMTVAAIDPVEGFLDSDLLRIAALASQPNPFDPMEKAILEKNKPVFGTLLKEYPLTRDLLAVARVYQDGLAATKGAPEAVAKLCGFSINQLDEINQKTSLLAEKGMRVLGIAKSKLNEGIVPKNMTEIKFQFMGLLALTDPLREVVPQAIRECHSAGIRVMMITGDYPKTAQAIAKQAGILNFENVLTGAEIEMLDEKTLGEKLLSVNVCARMVPEQKLKIVNALKAKKYVVGMTGDGVNDAPSLMQADVGIAMGKRGTDVAREASDLVLTDDHFASIVAGIRQGRKIFDNIKKAMSYVFSIHIPIAGMAMIPVLLGWPLALLPAHIVFLELVIDPACTLAFEAEKEEKNIMTRMPRDPHKPLFGYSEMAVSFIKGLAVLAATLFVYGWAITQFNAEVSRALMFVSLVCGNLSLIVANLSWNKSYLRIILFDSLISKAVMGGAMLFLWLSLNISFFKPLFHFETPPLLESIAAGAIGFFSVWLVVSVLKSPSVFRRSFLRP